jgi:hypothetical protein
MNRRAVRQECRDRWLGEEKLRQDNHGKTNLGRKVRAVRLEKTRQDRWGRTTKT